MKRSILPFLLIAIIVSVVLSWAAHVGMLGMWQNRLSDALYGGREPLKNIIIIAVDDKSLQEIGRWPWSRYQYVALLQKLNQSKLVGFDISFFEPSTPAEDNALGTALRSFVKTVIPREVTAFERQQEELIASSWLNPIPALDTIRTGLVNIFTDVDGVSRAIPTRVSDQDSFAFVLAEQFIGSRPHVEEQRMLINFVGRPQSFATYSFSDVIAGRILPETFADKIVLVGATAPDLHDDYLVPTSWGRRMAGVEIHAHALQTILTRTFLHPQSFASIVIIISIVSLLTCLFFWRMSEVKAALIVAVLFIAIFAVALVQYYRGLLVNVVHQPLAIVVASVVCVAYIARSESKHKQHILSVFGKYVSKDVVEHLLKSKQALELGGQERDISVLFVDIRGFTAIAEKLSPHHVIEFLNHYFGHMTDLVFKNNGTLDKFIGDSIMAVFNSPHNEPDHAYKAVKTALEMMDACVKLQKEGMPNIQIGIGVNTGKAVIGNMGSAQRQEFTAIGDTVNTSSRLCGVAEPGQVIISQSTYDLVKERVQAKKLEPLKVKGKEKALIVYEVTGLTKE